MKFVHCVDVDKELLATGRDVSLGCFRQPCLQDLMPKIPLKKVRHNVYETNKSYKTLTSYTYTRSVYEFVTCAMPLISFINKTLTRQTGYELAYGKVYKRSIRLRVFQVMASACALT